MPSPIPAGVLVIERSKSDPTSAFYAAKWRASSDARQIKKRLGPAWLDADGRDWRPRRGRVRDGFLDERRAHAAMAEAITIAEANDAQRVAHEAVRERSGRTFRLLAQTWLHHVEHIKRVKPSTLRDYQSVVGEPGVPHVRGKGVLKGRILKAFGDVPASAITVEDVNAFLASVAAEDVAIRTVNRQREVLRSIFNFGMSRESGFGLETNPAAEASLRRQDGPKTLEVFSIEQIEALARCATEGTWRKTTAWNRDDATVARYREEDRQLGELLRIACYTGLRRGELVTLRWGDVRWAERVLVVERALSHGVEVAPKSRRARYVPLADQPLAALERLSRRRDFTSADDYVFVNVTGDRLDPSALRRRYLKARDAAGLPTLRFHDLRHTAGSLLVRVMDPASVKDILGHADLKTTERYLHAQRASALSAAATRAFSMATVGEQDEDARLRLMLSQMDGDELRSLIERRRSAA